MEKKEELNEENIKNNEIIDIEKKVENKSKKKFSIFGINIWRILAYFIIYSVLGYIIETIFSMITKGTWESRQSFLYGPFCAIYGVGAVIMIVFLQFFKKNNNTLFWGGFVIGSITEYVISFLGEKLFNVIWWDYSNMPLNINGRICVFFSLFWGFLAIYLMSYVNPKIDKLIDWIKKKISRKWLKCITAFTTLFLFIDFLITGIALKVFYVRTIHNNNIQVSSKEIIDNNYEKIYNNEDLSNFIYKFWNDEKIIKTFPNLKTIDKEGNIVYFDMFFPDIKPYYHKFDQKWKGQLESILKQERENIEEGE